MPNKNKRRGGRSKAKKISENKNFIKQEERILGDKEVNNVAPSTSGTVNTNKIRIENSLDLWKDFFNYFEYLLNKAETRIASAKKRREIEQCVN